MYKIGILLLFVLSSCGLMKEITSYGHTITKEEMEWEGEENILPYMNANGPEVLE